MKHILTANSGTAERWLSIVSTTRNPDQIKKEMPMAVKHGWSGMLSIAYYRSLGVWTLLNGQWIKRH